ncbi:hypothetical protein ACFL05_00330 [Patescibacteria group bacterium]
MDTVEDMFVVRERELSKILLHKDHTGFSFFRKSKDETVLFVNNPDHKDLIEQSVAITQIGYRLAGNIGLVRMDSGDLWGYSTFLLEPIFFFHPSRGIGDILSRFKEKGLFYKISSCKSLLVADVSGINVLLVDFIASMRSEGCRLCGGIQLIKRDQGFHMTCTFLLKK